MKRQAGPVRYVRRGIIALGILLPTLSLVPFGSLWLWQNGYLIPWGIIACSITTAAFVYQYWLLRPLTDTTKAGDGRPRSDDTLALENTWSPREAAAWQDVLDVAETVDPDALNSREEIFALGQITVERVARRFHPDIKDPLWRFTVPEALSLIEQVSGRLKPFIRDNVPLGDRLTVGQVITLYRWTGFIDTAERAYDIWRIIRLLNPITAVMSEARERFSKKMYEWGRDELARRLARAYVKEVGRAAIDLYGGRLRVSPDELGRATTSETAADRALPDPAQTGEPLRLLLGGQTGVGKSSLVNALSKETRAAVDNLPTTTGFRSYELAIAGVPSALIVDSPAVGEPTTDLDDIVAAADHCDLLLWVISAARADRDTDRRALDALRRHFHARLDRRAPSVVVVATHIDQLRPFREWSPPYDLRDENNAKSVSIRAALAAIASDLGIDAGDVVPVSLEPPEAAYNVDTLWAKILDAVPEARRARLLRVLAEVRTRGDWRKVLSQASNAGRVLLKSLADR